MFEIKKTESSNKTIRMSNELIQQLEELAQINNVSFNNVVVQCCEYALQNLQKKESHSKNTE